MSIRNLGDRRTRRRADVRNATILSRNTDGTYQCQDLLTQQEFRAAKANRADEFTAGTRVVVAPMAAGRISIGGGSVILSRAPQEQRGAGLFPRGAIAQYTSPVVLSIDPSPIVLEQGGASVAATVYGHNLSEAPTYDNVEITDNTAPVVTSETITLDLAASASAPLGAHAMTIHGVTFDDAIDVIELPDTDILWLTYAQQNSGPSNFAGMVAIDTSTNAVTRGPFTSNALGAPATAQASYPVVIGSIAYCLFAHVLTNKLGRLEAPVGAGAGSYTDLGVTSWVNNLNNVADDGTGIVFLGGHASYGVGLHRAPLTGTGITTLYATAIYGRGLVGDGTNWYLGGTTASQIDAAFSTETAIATVASADGCINSTDAVFMFDLASGGTVWRVAKSGLAVTSLTYAAGHIPRAGFFYDGYLYMLIQQSGTGTYLDKIDPATMTSAGSLEMSLATLNNTYATVAAVSGTTAYLVTQPASTYPGRLVAVDLATLTISSNVEITDLPTVGGSVTSVTPAGLCVQ